MTFELVTAVQRKCPVCGCGVKELKPDSNPLRASEVGWVCTNCGWGEVTTHWPPMMDDKTHYRVYVSQNRAPTQKELREISERTMMNYLQVKRNLAKGDVLLAEGGAVDLYTTILELAVRGVNYYVDPAFPYPTTELDAEVNPSNFTAIAIDKRVGQE
jgi:uncharacterized Zn finger protein